MKEIQDITVELIACGALGVLLGGILLAVCVIVWFDYNKDRVIFKMENKND